MALTLNSNWRSLVVAGIWVLAIATIASAAAGCKNKPEGFRKHQSVQLDDAAYFYFSQAGRLEKVDAWRKVPTQYKGAVIVADPETTSSELSSQKTVRYADLYSANKGETVEAETVSWQTFNRISGVANKAARWGMLVVFRAEQMAVVDPTSDRRTRFHNVVRKLRKVIDSNEHNENDVSRETKSETRSKGAPE